MPLLSPKTANYQADIFSILPKTYSFRKRTMLRQAQHKSLTPSRSKPCPVWHPLPFDHHGYFYPLQQPTLPCDSKSQRRSPAMTCPWHRPPGQVCLLKWTPNLFPRNSRQTLRSLFGGSHVAPRSPQFRFSKWGDVRHLHRTAFGAVQVRTEGSGTLEFFYLYWLW